MGSLAGRGKYSFWTTFCFPFYKASAQTCFTPHRSEVVPYTYVQHFVTRIYDLGICSFGGTVFLAQYLQLVLGLSPWQAGIWMLPWTIGFIIGSLLNTLFIRFIKPVRVMTIGFVLAAIGYAILVQLEYLPPLMALVIGSVITSISMAPIFTLTTDFILEFCTA